MVAISMAKKKPTKVTKEPSSNSTTTIRVTKEMQSTIAQLAAMKDMSVQDLLIEMFDARLREELLEHMSRRADQLRGKAE